MDRCGTRGWRLGLTQWPIGSLLFVLGVTTRLPFRSQILYHWDSVNYALATVRFDVAEGQPHIPGYILYVALGWLGNLVTHDPQVSFVWLSVVFSGLSASALFHLGSATFDRRTGAIAALLLLTSPLFWFYGEVALPHVADAFFVTLLALLLYRAWDGEARCLVAAAPVLAIAGGIRPQTIAFLGPLWLLAASGVRRRTAVLATLLAAALVAFWLAPLLWLSGGPGRYLEIALAYSRGFSFGDPAAHLLRSDLSGTLRTTGRLVPYTAYGLGLAALPPVLYALCNIKALPGLAHDRRLRFLAVWVGPALLFYVFVSMGQQGVTFVYLPALLLLSAAALSGLLGGERGRRLHLLAAGAGMVAAVNAGIFLAVPERLPALDSQRVLTWSTIRNLDQHYLALTAAIRAQFPPEQTVLVGANWRHAGYYLPEYRLVRLPSGPADSSAPIEVVSAGEPAPASGQIGGQRATPGEGLVVVLLDGDPEQAPRDASVTRLALPQGTALYTFRLAPGETVSWANGRLQIELIPGATPPARAQPADTPRPAEAPAPPAFPVGPVISGLAASAASVPLYDKLELTFDVENTVATNLQFPYDPAPPPGLKGREGISVEGLFLPPGQNDWGQALRQPAFLYQDYSRQEVGEAEWLYPRGDPVWKVRFAPKVRGVWQYRIRAQDASICPERLNPCPYWAETPPATFAVEAPRSGSHGFVEVSKTDHRYFAYSDGKPFIGLGLNHTFQSERFTYDADEQIDRWAANGVELVRSWMIGSTIAGSSFMPWAWFGVGGYGGYMPRPGLVIAPADSGHDFVFQISQEKPCLFNGFTQGRIAVKPNATYRLAITTRVAGVAGPRDPHSPGYGLTAKLGQWPDEGRCPDGLAREPALLPYLHDTDWTTVEATITTGPSKWFLSYLYLILDNATAGEADVSQVSLREVLPDGGLGPEVLAKSRSDAHMDFNLLRSWDWDYVLDRAAESGVRLKLVVLEKNDLVWMDVNRDGTLSDLKDTLEGNDNFYASENTKVRRLHEYYWRYLAARWGYSTAVHSWELLNEGDPFNGHHYSQANEFARFMHEWDRNHMVTTSFWHSYPAGDFWANPKYPDLDYADTHDHPDSGPLKPDTHDEVTQHFLYSEFVRNRDVGKPTIRGETGIHSAPGEEDPELARDEHGVWLHNLTWAQLDAGGLYELQWWTRNIVKKNLYFQYRHVRDFLEGIPLDNGRYQDAQPRVSDLGTRVVGQKDVANGRAHLWIQNRKHTWWNVVNGVAWGRLSGTVTIPGFIPSQTYPVEWWQFDDPGNLTVRKDAVTADASGDLVLDLSSLPAWVTDVAVRIGQSP